MVYNLCDLIFRGCQKISGRLEYASYGAPNGAITDEPDGAGYDPVFCLFFGDTLNPRSSGEDGPRWMFADVENQGPCRNERALDGGLRSHVTQRLAGEPATTLDDSCFGECT